jgi:type 1 glutamine amidotransferase
LVLYSSPGAEILLKGGNRETVEKLLETGVGLTALHWATGIGDHNDQALVERYVNAMGGIFGFGWSGLDISQSRVEPADPQHPICRGWTSYPLNEEWYLDLKFLAGAKPIAKARVKDKDQVVAWAYERPGARAGRSYGNTLGHFHENFLIEPFRKAIVNGILWTTHREIPAAGAPCAIAGS